MSVEMTSSASPKHTPHVSIRWRANVPAILLLCIAILLPLITLDTNPKSGSTDLVSRLQPVDILTVLWMIAYLPHKALRIHQAAMVYALSLVISLSIGIALSDSSELSTVLVAFLALSMALVYWMLGYNAGRSQLLTTMLLYGLIISIFWEAIIVIHDYFSSSLWFVDEYPGRVRGTFHKNGQLGAFGFSSAGLLLSMGWALSTDRWWRGLTIVGAFLSVFFIWAAARRSALIAFAIWGLIITVILIMRNLRSKSLLPLLLVTLFALSLIVSSIKIDTSVTGQELVSGVKDIQQGNTFIEIQLRTFMAHSEKWFPFGIGPGRAQMLDVTYGEDENEIHNGHLALLVEIGVIGLLSFYWMAMLPILRRWNEAGGPHTRIVRILVITFIFAAAICALHNRLHRDRVFMLFLGLATTFLQTSDRERDLRR